MIPATINASGNIITQVAAHQVEGGATSMALPAGVNIANLVANSQGNIRVQLAPNQGQMANLIQVGPQGSIAVPISLTMLQTNAGSQPTFVTGSISGGASGNEFQIQGQKPIFVQATGQAAQMLAGHQGNIVSLPINLQNLAQIIKPQQIHSAAAPQQVQTNSQGSLPVIHIPSSLAAAAGATGVSNAGGGMQGTISISSAGGLLGNNATGSPQIRIKKATVQPIISSHQPVHVAVQQKVLAKLTSKK